MIKRPRWAGGGRWTKKRTVIGVLSILMVVLLVAAACGEEATPTPRPATATPVPPTPTPVPATATPIPGATATPVPPTATPPPGATATPVPPTPTPTPGAPTGLRPIEEWTVENPATLAEIEFELEKHRGESLVFVSWGGAYQAAQRQAYIEPFQNK
ncbi:MAG: hypothetical protein ACE5JL_12730, partial [Dehalococcoidia bacterium]